MNDGAIRRRYRLGRSLLQRKDYRGAIIQLSEVVAAYPGDFAAQDLLATARLRLRAQEGALSDAEHADLAEVERLSGFRGIMPIMARAFGIALAVAVVAVPAHFVFLSTLDYESEQVLRQHSWPVAEGAVLVSSASGFGGSPNSGGSLTATVEFTYEVAGTTYTTKQKWWGTCAIGCGSNDEKRVRERYQPGAAIEVHYDPADPGKAVVNPDQVDSDRTQLADLSGTVVVIALILGFLGIATPAFSANLRRVHRRRVLLHALPRGDGPPNQYAT